VEEDRAGLVGHRRINRIGARDNQVGGTETDRIPAAAISSIDGDQVLPG
jgi:hypothetical protein